MGQPLWVRARREKSQAASGPLLLANVASPWTKGPSVFSVAFQGWEMAHRQLTLPPPCPHWHILLWGQEYLG